MHNFEKGYIQKLNVFSFFKRKIICIRNLKQVIYFCYIQKLNIPLFFPWYFLYMEILKNIGDIILKGNNETNIEKVNLIKVFILIQVKGNRIIYID